MPKLYCGQKCLICEKGHFFIKKHYDKTVILHILREHPQYSIKCKYCDFRELKKEYIDDHIKQEHIDNCFICKVCGNIYVTKYLLKKHIKIHLWKNIYGKYMSKKEIIEKIENIKDHGGFNFL